MENNKGQSILIVYLYSDRIDCFKYVLANGIAHQFCANGRDINAGKWHMQLKFVNDKFHYHLHVVCNRITLFITLQRILIIIILTPKVYIQ